MASTEQERYFLSIIKERIEKIQPITPDQFLFLMGDYVLRSFDYELLTDDRDLKLIEIRNKVEDEEEEYDNSIYLETDTEPHYWFNLQRGLIRDHFLVNIKNSNVHLIEEGLIVSSFWEGLSSGVLPIIMERLEERQQDNIILGVYASKDQSSDALFNAYSALGLCLDICTHPLLILLDRARLESYVGVDRRGTPLRGHDLLEYLVEVFLSKTDFINNLKDVSQSFGINLYTPLAATGASLSVYGDIHNILESLEWRRLFDFDLSSCSLVYALFRVPSHLEGQLSKNQLDLVLNSWLKEKTDKEISQICEAVYLDTYDDRIDILLLAGGFESREFFRYVEDRIEGLKDRILEQKLMETEDWRRIKRALS